MTARRRYRPRPRVYVRTPGLGCLGCSIPCVLMPGLLLGVLLFLGGIPW